MGKIQKVLVFDYIFKCSVPETILGRTNYLKPPEIVKKGYEKKYKKKRFPAKTLCLHLSNLFDGKFPIKFFSKPRQLSIFSCVFFLVFGFLCWFFIFRRARRERILGGMGFSIKNPYNHGLKVAALKIGESSDLEHGIFLGKTRSGKSQLIKELIENILILKNQRVFVIDPKGELFKTFQNYPKNLINIDPYGKGIKIYCH